MKAATLAQNTLTLITKQKATAAVLSMLFVMVFFPTNFYSTFNLLDLLNSASIQLILAFGITLVIIVRAIDLSIGAILAISGIVTIRLMDHMAMYPAILLAVLFGALIGLVNGFLVVYQRTEPLIITLGVGMTLTGLGQQLTDARPVPSTNVSFMMIANSRLMNFLPNLVWIMLVVFALLYVILRYTQFGRNCYAIGGDYEVAEHSGIPVKAIKTATFVINGAIAAFAGVLLSSRLNTGSSIYGEDSALYVISAVVIGGTSLGGGVGGVGRTMMGLLVFAVMENAMNMLGINPYIQMIVRGVLVVVVLFFDSYARKKAREDV